MRDLVIIFPILFLTFLESCSVEQREFLKGNKYFKQLSGDMIPSINKGDIVFCKKLAKYQIISRFEIVVYENAQGTIVLKRVLGIPGDLISCTNGIMWINGRQLNDRFDISASNTKSSSIEYSGNPFSGISLSLLLSSNEYYTIGDNRLSSYDSRSYGPVRRDKIVYLAQSIFSNENYIELR